MTDLEILSAFKKFLKAERPWEFPEPKHSFRRQAIDGEDLPFKKKSALDWLGVWRRKKETENWDQFYDLYPEEVDKDEITLREQISKVTEILKWLEFGGKLISTDDKGRRFKHFPLKV